MPLVLLRLPDLGHGVLDLLLKRDRRISETAPCSDSTMPASLKANSCLVHVASGSRWGKSLTFSGVDLHTFTSTSVAFGRVPTGSGISL